MFKVTYCYNVLLFPEFLFRVFQHFSHTTFNTHKHLVQPSIVYFNSYNLCCGGYFMVELFSQSTISMQYDYFDTWTLLLPEWMMEYCKVAFTSLSLWTRSFKCRNLLGCTFTWYFFWFFRIYIIRYKILMHLKWTTRSVFSASGPRSVGMRMPACSLHSLHDSGACGVSFVLRCFWKEVSFSQSLPSLSCCSFSSMTGAFLVSFSVRAHGLVASAMGALINLEAGCQYWKSPDTSGFPTSI